MCACKPADVQDGHCSLRECSSHVYTSGVVSNRAVAMLAAASHTDALYADRCRQGYAATACVAQAVRNAVQCVQSYAVDVSRGFLHSKRDREREERGMRMQAVSLGVCACKQCCAGWAFQLAWF